MGFFGSKGEHHGDECLDRSGAWWAKPNPMGTGGNEARVIRPAGSRGHDADNKTTMHGSKAERSLMAGKGGLIKWSADRVRVTGEKPGGGRQR
jgi:hypothetical protein